MAISLARSSAEWLGRRSSAVAELFGLLAAERGRLAPWLAVALGAGVLLYFGLDQEPPEAAIWLAPPLLALAIWTAARWPLLGWGLGLVAAAALGFAAAAWQAGRQPPVPELPRGATILSARIAAVELLPEGRRLTLEAPRLDDGAPLARQVRIRLKHDDPAAPQPGDLIRVRALVRAPAPPAYPVPGTSSAPLGSPASPAAASPSAGPRSRRGRRAHRPWPGCAQRSRPASPRPCRGRPVRSPRRC